MADELYINSYTNCTEIYELKKSDPIDELELVYF